jgi:hypothetical protein
VSRIFRLYVPEEVADSLLDAINCYHACAHGRREEVEEAWLLEDDKTETGGTFMRAADRLDESVGENLRREIKHLHATDPQLQDILHRAKMMRKYGEPT